MVWPSILSNIITRFYEIQQKNGKLSVLQKNLFVYSMKLAYNHLSFSEKVDILIPDKAEYLTDNPISSESTSSGNMSYFLSYRFPPSDGFVNGTREVAIFKIGETYDRLGGIHGRFLSPVINGHIESALARAIPYYVPEKNIEDNPSYHIYVVKKQYPRVPRIDTLSKGTIAPAFRENPCDGGGVQYLSKERLISLIKMEGVLYEQKKR